MSDIKKYLGENSLSHLIEKILEKLSSKSDTTHNHDSSYDAKGAAATVQSNLDTLDDELDAHTGNSTIHVTSSNKTNWNTAYTHSQSTHARTDATKVAKSTINGNILIDGTETTVYTHPSGTNPHGTTKSDVGLGNVDNTSDANKPVSTAQKAAIDAVQDNVDTVQDELTEHIDNDDIHFTADERTKLSGIATGANKYTHPSSGVTAGTYKSVTVDAQGHVTAGTNPTTLAGYGITDADSKGAADTALTTAKSYTDTKISNLINGAPTTLDTLGEIASAMEENADVVEALEEAIGTKANASDLTAHTGNTSNPHSVTKSQVGLGNVENKSSATIRGELTKTNVTTALGYTPYTQTEIDDLLAKKVDAVSGKGLSTNDYTTTEKTKLSGIATGAEVNQNAFSNIKVGDTTVAADAKTDTLTLAGSNVTITPDATNDKITFAVADGSTSAKGLVQLTNSTSSTSTTTAATPASVKSAYDLANTAKTNAATAQTKADSAYTLAESKADSLSDLGVTATATELNYMDGVTSNVQAQLDGKASSAAATTSANGLMTSAMVTKLNGIAEGANKYSLPTASSSTLGGVKTTSTVTSNSGYTACPIISGVPYYKDTNTTYSLGSFGITATSTELNYCDGVTSNIQTQLNGKAASSHGTHVTYDTNTPKANGTATVGTSTSVSRGDHVHPLQTTVSGNAGSATKVNNSLAIKLNGGSTEGTNLFTFNGSAAKTVDITPSAIGAAASSHGTHVSYGTSAAALGTSSAGSASTVSRSDHVHALPALTSCTGTLTVAKGGTGVNTLKSGQVLVGNGTGAVTTRAIDTTAGGTSGSTSLITSGAVYSGLSNMISDDVTSADIAAIVV